MNHAKSIALVACITVGISASALAQLGGGAGVIFAYAGYLERDGTPMNDVVDITVEVFSQANGGAACDSVLETDVLVSGGNFSLSVGPIDEACVLNETVHLELQVQGTSDAAPVSLTGRTQIRPALQAYTGATSGDFDVPQLLTAGSVFTGTIQSSGLTNTGTLGTTRLNATGAGLGLDVTNDADIGGALGVGESLDVDGRINADGPGTGLLVDNNATVNGTLTTTNLNVTGNLTLPACPTSMTRMGAWCITTTKGSASSWGNAINGCQDDSAGPLQVCPMEAIIHCDQINHQKGTPGTCGTLTDQADPDGNGGNTSSAIMTGSLNYNAVTTNESAFRNAACFIANFEVGPAIDWSNAVTNCTTAAAYFCCKAAR